MGLGLDFFFFFRQLSHFWIVFGKLRKKRKAPPIFKCLQVHLYVQLLLCAQVRVCVRVWYQGTVCLFLPFLYFKQPT